MRKLVSLIHLSLDGFCAGPNGEMDWITVNPAIFEDADRVIATAGAAVLSCWANTREGLASRAVASIAVRRTCHRCMIPVSNLQRRS